MSETARQRGLFTGGPSTPTQRALAALALALVAALTWPIAVVGVGTAALALFFSVRLLRSKSRDARVAGVVVTFVSVAALLAALFITGLVAYEVITGPTTGSISRSVEPQQQ